MEEKRLSGKEPQELRGSRESAGELPGGGRDVKRWAGPHFSGSKQGGTSPAEAAHSSGAWGVPPGSSSQPSHTQVSWEQQ